MGAEYAFDYAHNRENDEGGPREIVDLTPLRRKIAVMIEHDHQYDDPSTWSDEYRDWVKKSPHGAAVSVAQQAARRAAPSMDMHLGERDDATSAVQHMMRRGGHPDADDAFVMKHAKPGWGQSQAFFSDGEPGIALHPSRWDYGTAAHEVAHHLHMHELGRKPHDDAEAHGPDFVKYYQSVLDDFGPDASETLGDAYHEALGHLHHEGAFTPTKRLFGPTQGLDVRLFDGAHLKPDVRAYIMGTLDGFWKPLYGPSWTHWSRVYFAGSEASEWTSESLEGNNDFDVLIGVHYDRARLHVPHFAGLSDQDITDLLNKQFKTLDVQTAVAYIPVDGQVYGPFSNTWFVNANSWDIKTIKPYAAYDVSSDSWAVAPPHLPTWSIKDFPEGPALIEEARAVSAYVKAVLKLPEPYRSQQGFALWQHLHSDRARAFGPNGEGWYDPGNVLEKWLDQAGLWDKLVEIMIDVKAHPDKLLAPVDWSNMPKIAMPWRMEQGEEHMHPDVKSVRDAGFHGYVGESAETREERGEEPHEQEFDEDAYDEATPEPTHEEQRHYEEHDDYPDSYHERHDQAYQQHMDRKAAEDEPDHEDDELHHFIGTHGADHHFWQQHASLGMVNIKDRPVYGTQSHVSQTHIDKYRADPDAEVHKPNYHGEYSGDQAPMFVTHEGRLHAIEGHHRVAAALQRGDQKIHAWHYDADRHGLPQEEEDEDDY